MGPPIRPVGNFKKFRAPDVTPFELGVMGDVPFESGRRVDSGPVNRWALLATRTSPINEGNFPMLTQNLLTVNVEKNDELDAPKAGYVAPQIFAVGQTVELIQGFDSNGWYDVRFGYHRS